MLSKFKVVTEFHEKGIAKAFFDDLTVWAIQTVH